MMHGWKGHLMHCWKEKDEICALDLPTCIILGISDMVYGKNTIRKWMFIYIQFIMLPVLIISCCVISWSVRPVYKSWLCHSTGVK